MTNTSLFNFNGSDIRTVKIDGQPWFVAMDTLLALGYPQKSHGMILRKLSPDESILNRIESSPRSVRLVSESGLYKLVMRSDKPEAQNFQNWVTKVVLPAIRKDGGYIHGEEHVVSGAMTEDELVFKAMEVMKRKVDRLSAENAKQEAIIQIFFDDHNCLRWCNHLPAKGASDALDSLNSWGSCVSVEWID